MAISTEIRTYFNGTWHEGDVAVMRAADHGAWLASTVFDGARFVDGMAPDLLAHCERVNRSARALLLEPTHAAEEIARLALEGCALFPEGSAIYIRPMYWGIDGNETAVQPDGSAGFAICLETVPMAPPEAAQRLTTTRFRRPTLEVAVCNAKAGCLYPNNGRMLAEARSKGFDNALVADMAGNVAETATANVFIVKDGAVFTPIANGTFLAGITRARHIANLRAAGVSVHETVMSFADVHAADEVFLSGNLNKVTPVTEFDGTRYPHGPVTRQALDLYWAWARSDAAG
ncbi:branched-chain amino acid aminotransferase [Mangrovicoccus algicola]|uniref:Probable branched-chain-amino-acid aminotransferase n=1 Tax=Mangrovicoccus algicola TaxID=2771008 RepID=A0A8J6Z0M6_9RHOB|nr:branched-chain amino acid aminotransferase [Mangrovicoccus algicola]MBE3639413.1 branched-chain amino acid aminotransferase [Mangrovicoccus algicola]